MTFTVRTYAHWYIYETCDVRNYIRTSWHELILYPKQGKAKTISVEIRNKWVTWKLNENEKTCHYWHKATNTNAVLGFLALRVSTSKLRHYFPKTTVKPSLNKHIGGEHLLVKRILIRQHLTDRDCWSIHRVRTKWSPAPQLRMVKY